MTLRRGLHVADENGEGADALEARLALAALFASFGVIDGMTVTGRASWAYNVAAGKLVSSRSAADGAVLFANDSPAIVGTDGEGTTIPPAPATGSRIDIIYALHHDVDNNDADSRPVFGVASGVAEGTPNPPTIPVGAVELARATLAAGATNTAHANVTISIGNTPRAQVRGNRHVMVAMKTSVAYNLANNLYDGIGTASPWTAIGPATFPPEFAYEAGNKLVNGQGLRAVIPGLYRLSASVQFDTNSTGLRGLRIIKNGSGTIVKKSLIAAMSGTRTSIQLDGTTYLETGDTLGVQAIQNSGGPLALYLGEDSPSIVMEYLGS